VEAIYEPVRFSVARWVKCQDKKKLTEFQRRNQAALAHDAEGFLTYLAESEWMLNFFMEKWPDIEFEKTRENV
jgi:peptide chain release factor 3